MQQMDPIPFLKEISHRIFHFKPKLVNFFPTEEETLNVYCCFAGISFLVREGFENEIHFLLEAKGCELQGEA